MEFIKILQKLLKLDLMIQIMNQTGHFLQEKIGLIKEELGGKVLTKLVGLRAKTYSYLIHDGSENKNAKDSKKCVIKRKHKFESYKNYLKVTQLENKINHLEKNEVDADSLKKDHKELIKNKKLILKTQRRFKSERQ